jgi:hypothetical protein
LKKLELEGSPVFNANNNNKLGCSF